MQPYFPNRRALTTTDEGLPVTNWFKVAREDRDRIITQCGERAPAVLAVWLAFCDIANVELSACFARSTAEIARLSGVAQRTVERVLPILRQLGLIEWQQVRSPDNRGLQASMYRLPSFAPPTDIQTVLLPPQSRHPTDNESGLNGGVLDRKTVKTWKTSPIVPNGDETKALEDQVSEVYEAYPRKVSKPAAFRAITKAIRAHGFDKVMGATVEYAKARNGEDQQFTPYPARWFKEERYLEDPRTWRPSNGADLLSNLRRALDKLNRASDREKAGPGFGKKKRDIEDQIQKLEATQSAHAPA